MKLYTFYKLASIPVILLTLQSCFSAGNYVRPEVVDESTFRTDQLPQDSLSVADISWREMFTDEILIGHIEEGLQNNLDIRIAMEQINQAETYLRQGQAGYYPELNAGAQVAGQQNSDNTGGSGDGFTQFELSGTLSWEADIWGRIRSNTRALDAAYLQTVAAHQAVKTGLIANITSAYYQLLALDEQMRITQETILNRENSLQTTIALKDAGFVTEAGVMQTEAQLHTARALLIDLRTNIHLLENTLSILLGKAPEEITRSHLNEQELTPDIEIGFPVQLLHNRPDVIAAEYNLINAFELTNVARSQFYPSLNVSASGGLQSLELDNLLSANSLFANIVGSLTQPVFNRRRLQTQYDVSLSRQEQAYLGFRQAILNAGMEVSDAMYSFQAAEEKIEVESQQYAAYEQATVYSEELLNSGMANYLEVLTARENVLNSQLNLINTRYDRLDAVVELYRALGGGWR